MGLHSEGLNIISEGYLRLRFFFFWGGGGGRHTFGRACFRGGGGTYYLRTQAWRAGRVLQRVFFFFGISHSPRTPLGHAHRWSICKHYVDKLQRFSPKCHNIFILTMPTALGWRSGAVYGEKSPKTRLVRIYCYGNTLYIVNLITW